MRVQHRSPIQRLALASSALAALAGCSVGPNFTPPPPPAPTAGYVAPSAPVSTVAALGDGPADGWWQGFGSADLDALVARALAGNQDVAAADATLARASAQVAAVAGRRLPQVDANGRIEREEINLAAFGFDPSTLPGGKNPIINLYTLGGGVSFDPDLWGRNRRAMEEARADSTADAYAADAARLTIAGRVTMQFLAIAALNDRLNTLNALIGESQRNVSLTQARKNAGEGTLVDVIAAQTQLAEDQGMLPALEQARAEARDMLAVLLGTSPAELGPSDWSLATLRLPSSVAVSVPSTLVHRRPDILAAEARLHAAVAAIGVATADLYPNITIGASYTQAASAVDSIFSSGFRGFDVFGGVTAPIFHGGTIKAKIRGARAEAAGAAAHYRETVLESFAQVANLLSALDTDARGEAAATTAADLAARSLDLSRRSFQVGNSGVLQVLDANRADERARLAVLDARARRFENIAQLLVATAGGVPDAATSHVMATGGTAPPR